MVHRYSTASPPGTSSLATTSDSGSRSTATATWCLRTLPTGYLGFVAQDDPQLIQEVRLIGGYRWDPETREIGSAVVSARDGRHKVLWVLELAETTTASGVIHFQPQQTDSGLPGLPQIVESVEIEKDSGSE